MDASNQSICGSSTSSTLPSQPTKKQRVALACKRCKRRKQRCDGSRPMCMSCDRAGTACVYERTVRPHYPGGKTLYISALEERIAFLEARLPAYAEDHFNSGVGKPEAAVSNAGGYASSKSRPGSSPSHYGSVSDDMEAEESNSIVDSVAYLSLCATGTADTAAEPFYLGSSSGATIARMIQTSIFRNSGGRAIPQTLSSLHTRRSAALHPQLSSETYSTQKRQSVFEFPFRVQAQLLFDTFFDKLHTRWPLLDQRIYTALFDRQYDQGSLSIMERSIMHLIYAIAARFLQLTRCPCEVDPEKHLIAAIEPMDFILEQHNMGTVQFLLLLALHGQRSPYGAGAWSQVRYAVSLCIELGLHRERQLVSSHHSPRDLEIRRRVFWSCYCLDRGTSVLLGRAFAIADRDINVEMPNPSLEFWDLTHKDAPNPLQESPWSNIEPFIHIIKLERIQSRIHRTVFRVDKNVVSGPPSERAKLDEKMAHMRSDLDNWLETIPHPPKGGKRITWMYDPESANHDSQDFFNLQYHKAMLALFTVLLPKLEPSDHRFITSARSAASVCVAYKRLNQQKTLSYTMISLHSTFVAGLTLVYCLWRNRDLFGYDVFEATQACSQSLTIFGEKWSGAVKYRDIFDALSGSLFKKLVNPTSCPGGAGFEMRNRSPQRTRTKSGTKSPTLGSSPDARQTAGDYTDRTLDQEPTMSEMVSDAVKEAFMEVDEEAPGGWQGWHMWNEMLGGGSAQGHGAGWGCDGERCCEVDQLWNTSRPTYDPMEAGECNFRDVDSLR